MHSHTSAYAALVLSLPTENGTVRMRVYRALKALGCGVLRDGIYLLPDTADARAALHKQAADVRAAGGAAYLLSVAAREDAPAFSALFDRTADYAQLIARIESAEKKIARADAATARRVLKQYQRDLQTAVAIDYFPGPAQAQAVAALAQLETRINAKLAPDEPRAIPGDIAQFAIADFQARTWATRAELWVDRVASAWLIRRFIDRKARFRWLTNIKRCPRTALSFDFDGARFTHVGARVTFEVLVASFGLDGDNGLSRIAALVHYLDVGGVPVAEAPGLTCMLTGLRERAVDDDIFLRDASVMFDALYAAYGNASTGTAEIVPLRSPRAASKKAKRRAAATPK